MSISLLPPLLPFKYNYGNIPTAFDQCFTLEQQMLWIRVYINNTLIEKINEQSQVINKIDIDEAKKYTDSQIEILKSYVNQKDEELSNTLTAYILEVAGQLDITLKNYSDNNLQTARDLIEALKIQLEAEIAEISQNVQVFNPVVGYITSIQEAVMDLYEMQRTGAITAIEFDALELTSQEFDNKEITAKEFDLNGKALLTA